MTDDSSIIVTPVSEEDRPSVPWTPVVREETCRFLESAVPRESREYIQTAAVSVLSRGTPPTLESGQETGLIIGYVQSGKTMSFEAVAALARDNSYQVVIVIAGISNPLLEQSAGRLRRDLGLDDSECGRRWIHFQNPSAEDATIQAIRDALDDWRDPETPEHYKRTVLVTVLKHHLRLQNLSSLFASLCMQGVPVLVIDDEADQVSLNNEAGQGQESTTYRRLMELRQTLPNHSYLQYTATPQAPLLISIIDSLSPNFVEVLEPGADYVGGQEFFGNALSHVRVIPSQEVPTNNNPLSEPPETLLAALRIFMVGVTAGLFQGSNTGNRSMLVHPSHLTAQHQEYYYWVRNIFEEWKHTFRLENSDPDKQELLEDFKEAYDDIATTVDTDLPSFEQLLPHFPFAFRNTRIIEVNARGGRTPEVDWRSSYGWILVGGQAMDRGFTVKGLTVTYMPRGIGAGNADTVQQRARFFGYKRNYLGFCRIYLEESTLTAFLSYVTHEEDIRSQLQQIQADERSLNEWKRAFLLDRRLRPCRDKVLEFDYIRGQFSDDWVSPRVIFATQEVTDANRTTVDDFVRSLEFIDNDGNPERTDVQRHKKCTDVPLSTVLGNLLVPMRITGKTDSQRYTGLLLQLGKALEENASEVCTIYLMSPAARRQRSVNDSGEVTNLFQGEAPVHPIEKRGEIYPGDRAIKDEDRVTIQIHRLDLLSEGAIVAEDVPVIAVWMPSRLAHSWISQEQGL